MAKMIFISPYLKGRGEKAALARRTKYIATREGVELLKDTEGGGPATVKQRSFIQRLLSSFPQARELGEYEDYALEPTKAAASELIDQVWEQFITAMDQRENYLDYVAHRPGVQREGDHGLWNAGGRVPDLSAAVREVAEHEGNVWTPIVSLRREDAERLGYTDVENWRALVCSCLPELAKGYKIQPDNLRWYAALHEKEKHVHIHMIVFSSDPTEGYLTVNGIREIKSAFARQIFAQDLVQVYEQKTRYRNAVQSTAAEEMARLIAEMETGQQYSERLCQLTEELAQRLKTTKGKKVYGYLPPQTKRIVDAIVDELAKDERVAAAYSLWQDMRDEVCRTYSEVLPERLPLSQQKEFKPVRNMVVREALKLSEQSAGFEDEDMEKEPDKSQAEPEQSWEVPELRMSLLPGTAGQRTAYVRPSHDRAEEKPSTSAASAVIRMLHHMSRIFRESTTDDAIYRGLQIDRKRWKELQELRIALGHNPDDHEDQTQAMQ